jgi:ubiquinone/menaquinone biosynthesis C-methylase UbiE
VTSAAPGKGHRPVGGFSQVDRSESPELFLAYLDNVRSNERWRQWKAETLDLMDLSPGGAGLDVGCGTGEEVAAIAKRVGNLGLAVGLDASTAMTSAAFSRHRDTTSQFVVGSALDLPFGDETFDAVRTERTLQHVADPAAAVAEMARVLRPNGRLVAFEPDWETLVYSAPDEETSRAISAYRGGLNPSRTVGRHLVRLMAEVGVTPQHSAGRGVTVRSYEHAEYAFNIEASAEAAVQAGAVNRKRASAWIASLRAADADGGFLAAAMNILVLGSKAI